MELINQQRDRIAKPEPHPTVFSFEIGGFNSACHRVEFKDGRLEYSEAKGAYTFQPAVVLELGPGAWERFWRAVEAAGVWKWEECYDNPDVLDGTQWTLTLRYQGRSIETSGSNAFPGSNGMDFPDTCEFGQFIKAVLRLTGKAIV